MNNTLALMRREWLQHRFAWALLALLPTLLAVALLSLGEVQIAAGERGPALPLALAAAALAAGMALQALMLWIVALIVTAGLARRDHGDRSLEFWLSLPTGHAESLAVPLLVHLVLLPVAALAVGLAGGAIASFVLVSRVEGPAAWLALPWATLGAAALTLAGRVALGIALATLWLAPLLLMMVWLTAVLGRWGLAVMALGVGVGSVVLDQAFGIPWPAHWLALVMARAQQSVLDTGAGPLVIETAGDIGPVLEQLPAWLASDALQALALAASPAMAGGLAAAAACFALLVRWRARGAL